MPLGSTVVDIRNPASSYCRRYSHAIAMKCGYCHAASTPNKSHAVQLTSDPPKAVYPINIGSAPAMAPIVVFHDVRVFIGV